MEKQMYEKLLPAAHTPLSNLSPFVKSHHFNLISSLRKMTQYQNNFHPVKDTGN